jgi:hypothetical protein
MQRLRSGLRSSIMMPIGSQNGVSPAVARSPASCSMRGSWLIGG